MKLWVSFGESRGCEEENINGGRWWVLMGRGVRYVVRVVDDDVSCVILASIPPPFFLIK